MGSQSKRQCTVDRKRTDQLGQSSRRIAQANEDRLRLRRQRYAEQQAERRAASSSEPVASGSQRGIRQKVMEMVDKLKSLSGESVEYESKILTRFLQHSSISKALKRWRELVLNWWTEETRVSPIAKRVLKRQNHAIHTLDKTQTEFYELFMLSHSMGLKDEHGREKRRLELVFVETPVSKFIQFMKSKLAHFVKHDFTQK
ncbi:hypothetical protein R1sor_017120 [Riccia sorocarpa]|uniref:Uncharacterized protein n=1 Tax=Riccia sorocarpa TaxID=122646 RepID=A0ABD3I6A7_9MARC